MRSCRLLLPLLACAAVSCATPAPRLPPPLPGPVAGIGPATDPASLAAGRVGLTDRDRAGSGFACADCHRLRASDGPRPAPDLMALGARAGLWRGLARDVSEAIGRCAERYQARPAPAADALSALRAALEDPGPGPPAPADPYAAACAHCHEGGPAPALLGRPWSRRILVARLRGAGPPGPDQFMPRFAPTVLSDHALDHLLEHLDRAVRSPVGSGDRE